MGHLEEINILRKGQSCKTEPERKENMNKPITNTEMETVFLKTSHKHIPGPDGSQMNSIKHLLSVMQK